MRELLHKALTACELGAVLLLGRLLGVTWVVRYLRHPNPRITIRVLRAFGAHVGDGTTVKRGLHIDNAFEDENATGDFSHLTIGRNCYIGDGVYFDLAGPITIGDDAVLAGEVAILTHGDCNRSAWLAERFPRVVEPVHVGAGAWLCFRSTLLAGVRVGEQTVVAAHSLLRGNADARCVYAGVPAKRIQDLDRNQARTAA